MSDRHLFTPLPATRQKPLLDRLEEYNRLPECEKLALFRQAASEPTPDPIQEWVDLHECRRLSIQRNPGVWDYIRRDPPVRLKLDAEGNPVFQPPREGSDADDRPDPVLELVYELDEKGRLVIEPSTHGPSAPSPRIFWITPQSRLLEDISLPASCGALKRDMVLVERTLETVLRAYRIAGRTPPAELSSILLKPASPVETSPPGVDPPPPPVTPLASEAAPRLDPGTRVIAAAYQLSKDRKPVSLRAACQIAKVDRGNLRRRYPEAVRTIEDLAKPDRAHRRGVQNRRNGNLDAIDDDSEN